MGLHRRFLASMSVVLLLAALSGCQREGEPARLDFDTDPRILRGVWIGDGEAGDVLRLEAQAHDPSDSGYLVTGTFTLADAEPVAFSGEVFQPLKPTSGTLRPQTSYPPPFYANSEDGQWRLQGAVSAGLPPRLQVLLSGPETEDFFFMTREADRLPLPEDDDAPIRTDRERYTPEDLGGSVRYTIEATYTNTAAESVYLAPCGYEPPSYYLERFDGEAWRTSNFSDACLLVPAPAVEVAPGGTFDATIEIAASSAPNAFPQLGTDLVPGIHRLVYAVATGVDDEGFPNDDLLPLEQRVSNAFELVTP